MLIALHRSTRRPRQGIPATLQLPQDVRPVEHAGALPGVRGEAADPVGLGRGEGGQQLVQLRPELRPQRGWLGGPWGGGNPWRSQAQEEGARGWTTHETQPRHGTRHKESDAKLSTAQRVSFELRMAAGVGGPPPGH